MASKGHDHEEANLIRRVALRDGASASRQWRPRAC